MGVYFYNIFRPFKYACNILKILYNIVNPKVSSRSSRLGRDTDVAHGQWDYLGIERSLFLFGSLTLNWNH